jgi:hypothetical protein
VIGPVAPSRGGAFRTRHAGYNKRVRAWACKGCHDLRVTKPERPNVRCVNCGAELGWWYLASKGEQKRFRQLVLLQRQEEIRDLWCQQRYPLAIAGDVLTTYVADFVYWDIRKARLVIEDVKGRDPRGDTALSKLKIKIFEALYRHHGFKVTLVRP